MRKCVFRSVSRSRLSPSDIFHALKNFSPPELASALAGIVSVGSESAAAAPGTGPGSGAAAARTVCTPPIAGALAAVAGPGRIK